MSLAFLRTRLFAALVAAALLGEAACSGARPPGSRTPSAPPNPRLGVTGVARARFLPEAELRIPGKGRGTGLLRGAGQGFAEWASAAVGSFRYVSCTNAGCAAAAVFVLAFAAGAGTVGAIVGGIEGAVTGAPDDAARKVERNARSVLVDLEIQEKAAESVMRRALERGFPPFRDLGDRGPARPAREVDYRALSREGIDTVLETAVTEIGFAGSAGKDPPLALTIAVRARLCRTADGATLFEETFDARSPAFRLEEWEEDESALFLQWIDHLLYDVAGRILQRAAAA